MSNTATAVAQSFEVVSEHPVFGRRVVATLVSETGANVKARRLSNLAGALNAETTYSVVPV